MVHHRSAWTEAACTARSGPVLAWAVMFAMTGCFDHEGLRELDEDCAAYGDPAIMDVTEMNNGDFRVTVPSRVQDDFEVEKWQWIELEIGTARFSAPPIGAQSLAPSESIRWTAPGPILQSFSTNDPPGEPDDNTAPFSPGRLPADQPLRAKITTLWSVRGLYTECRLAIAEVERR